MSTKIFNLTITSAPIPGPNFFYSRDTEGKMTGRHTFTAVKGSMQMPSNQSRFAKGTPVTTLDTSIISTMAFMTLDDWEADTVAGGFEEITANFSGYSESGDFEFDREVSYSSNNSLVERSILENPNYLREVISTETRDCFARVYNGHGTATPSFSDGDVSNVFFYDILGNQLLAITDEDSLKWYRLIFIEDNRTFMAPTYEWTRSAVNEGGLSNADLAKLGKIDSDPPGGPPEPPDDGEDYTWVKTGANEVRGENTANTEETWTWAKWPEAIYAATP